MLHSLEIKNYRNLRHLIIPKLGRVNLVIGKNNTGKSSLLEAVAILNTNDIWETLYAILGDRGEEIDFSAVESKNRSEAVFSSLFYKSMIDYWDLNTTIEIKGDNTLSILRFVYGLIGFNNNFLTIVEDKSQLENRAYQGIGVLSYKKNKEEWHHFISGRNLGGNNLMTSINEDVFKYVSPSLLIKTNSLLWDKIVLTNHKKAVIDALCLIDSKISDLDFNSNGEAFIRHDELGKLPLKRMGDGINRILTIILKMGTCENGYLLIDEFENGLHYSVQEKLWEIIFQLADQLNIQVFATTHSNDTIDAFSEVATRNPSYADAQLIKLRNINGDIDAVTLTAEEAKGAQESPYLDLRR